MWTPKHAPVAGEMGAVDVAWTDDPAASQRLVHRPRCLALFLAGSIGCDYGVLIDVPPDAT